MSAASINALSLYLRTGAGLSDADRERIADGLDAYVSLEAETLDSALGLKAEPGQRSARTRMAIDARDEIVREIAGEFFGGLVPAAQAAGIALAWRRYAAAGWIRERSAATIPQARVGSLEGHLWRAMRLRDHALSERSIRQLLSDAAPRLAAS